MCLLTTVTGYKGQYKIGTVSIPPLHYRDVKELVEFECNIVKAERFAPDLTFDLDRVTRRMRFKTESVIFFFAVDDYYFRRLGFKPCFGLDGHKILYGYKRNGEHVSGDTRGGANSLRLLGAIDSQIVGNSKAMLMHVFPIKGVHGEQQSWQFIPLYQGF